MNRAEWGEAWAALPGWGKWLGVFTASLGLAVGVGALTPLGAGNAVFLTGALLVFVSTMYVRLGGPRTRIGRDLDGRPLWALEPGRRSAEIRKGLAILSLALALWAALALVTWARTILG